jgi:hypothetical protein
MLQRFRRHNGMYERDHQTHAEGPLTVIWFLIWLVADTVGAHEPLIADPVDEWAAALILAIGLDLGAAHARTNSAWR